MAAALQFIAIFHLWKVNSRREDAINIVKAILTRSKSPPGAGAGHGSDVRPSPGLVTYVLYGTWQQRRDFPGDMAYLTVMFSGPPRLNEVPWKALHFNFQ